MDLIALVYLFRNKSGHGDVKRFLVVVCMLVVFMSLAHVKTILEEHRALCKQIPNE